MAGLRGQPRRVIRQRVVLYSAVMLLLLGIFSSRVMSRDAVELAVARAPGLPYLVQDDGRVRNLFALNVTNTEPVEHRVTLTMDGPAGVECIVPGQPLLVPAGGRIRAEAFVLISAPQIASSETPIVFRLWSGEEELCRAEAIFLGPIRRRAE